jgi:DNA-directed RNA polymerase specialized sigma subunit
MDSRQTSVPGKEDGRGRPRSPFAKWPVLKEEILRINEKIGHAPTHMELRKAGESKLIRYISMHGGMAEVMHRVGCMPKNRTGKYSLGIWDNFQGEIDGMISKLGHFPTTSEMGLLKRYELIPFIRQHGGINEVRRRMGYPPIRSTEKIPREYPLRAWDNLEKELNAVISGVGHFPTSRELRGMGRRDMEDGISKNGGFIEARRRMGYPVSERRTNASLLGVWENLERELKGVVSKLGHFPTYNEIRLLKRRDISRAFGKHGGINEVRLKMGFPAGSPGRTGEGRKTGEFSLKVWSNLERELAEIISEMGHFPTCQELDALGRGDIVTATRKYHGRINSVRRRMGYVLLVKNDPASSLRVWGNLESELGKIISKIGHFPTNGELRKIGREDVLCAIKDKFGGATVVRQKMGHPLRNKFGKYSLNKWENFEAEMKGVIKRLGYFPMLSELYAIGRGDLMGACRFYGGIRGVRERITGEKRERREMIISPYKIELFNKAKKGDKKAMEEIMQGYFSVVRARLHMPSYAKNRDDLCQEIRIMILQQLREKRDAASFYMGLRSIVQSRIYSIAGRERWRGVKLSQKEVAQLKFIRKTLELLKIAGREPTPDELTEITGISEFEIDRLISRYGRFVSLDAPLPSHSHKSEGNERTYADIIPEVKKAEPEASKLLDEMSKDEREIVSAKLGIGRYKETYKQISERTGLSLSNVKEIFYRVLRYIPYK